MPIRPQTPCNKHGCPALSDRRYCKAHKDEDKKRGKEYHRRTDKNRQSARKRGYDSKWDKARLVWLRKHPLCVYCEKDGRVTAARIVDHIEPHKMDMVKFWDNSNWQSLCKTHHDIKTGSGM